MSLSPRTRPAPGLVAAAVLVIAVLLALAVAAASGIDVGRALGAVWDSFFPPPAATAEGVEIRDLYTIVFILAATIFVVVEALIVWAVLRYRRRPGDDELPAQTHGNNLAETLWTVIPTLIVGYLFFISWQTLNSVEAKTEQPPVQVRAIAAQFQWTFEYLAADGETVEYKQQVPTGQTGGLFLPVGQPIRVKLESPDVIHAFYVPRFLFKRDVIPGKVNEFEFTINPEEEGQTLRGQCAELCGTGHRIMTFDVHALSATDYAAWLEEAKASAQPSEGPAASLPPGATILEMTASGIAFPTKALDAPAGQPFAIHFLNEDPAGTIHDIDIRDASGATLQDQRTIDGGEEATYNYTPLDAGEYTFICSIHPVPAMTGTLTVQ
jgi:cytochrome c oxidase subunit 2